MQQLWGYKVEEKLHLGVREQKRSNSTALENTVFEELDLFPFLDPGVGGEYLGCWVR
jgi:hypothetical protein